MGVHIRISRYKHQVVVPRHLVGFPTSRPQSMLIPSPGPRPEASRGKAYAASLSTRQTAGQGLARTSDRVTTK